MKIDKLGEFGLIDQIKAMFGPIDPAGVEGIGDDCAVVDLGGDELLVITTDALVEGVHFLCDAITPYELGYKSLAVNLSDVAAMGATPFITFLSIALPPRVEAGWCTEFLRGYRSHNVPLVGGDTTGSIDKIFINVTAVGRVSKSRIKRRSDARVGDRIYVTGTLGDSAAGLKSILQHVDNKALIAAHHMPRPHLAEGQWLGKQASVHAMMDISDGLASDLGHILRASGVGAKVDMRKVPISDELYQADHQPIETAITGGEDYVLLLTAGAEFDDAVVDFDGKLYEIGEITAGSSQIVWCDGEKALEADFKGFSHF